MTTYFTSDWHVGHTNVLTFDQRPFKDLDHMHRVLVNNYNATVRPEDTCWFLGDLGLNSNNTLAEIVSKLHGTKVFVLGNHDKGAEATRRLGFTVVMNAAMLEIGGQPVTLSHCPLRGVWREDATKMHGYTEGDNWHKEVKHGPRFSVPDWGQFHLHGHIHANPNIPGKPVRTAGKQFDVGVAANDYRPVSQSQIESWISTYMKGY